MNDATETDYSFKSYQTHGRCKTPLNTTPARKNKRIHLSPFLPLVLENKTKIQKVQGKSSTFTTEDSLVGLVGVTLLFCDD